MEGAIFFDVELCAHKRRALWAKICAHIVKQFDPGSSPMLWPMAIRQSAQNVECENVIVIGRSLNLTTHYLNVSK